MVGNSELKDLTKQRKYKKFILAYLFRCNATFTTNSNQIMISKYTTNWNSSIESCT